MLTNAKYFFLPLCLFILTGCEKQYSYTELMQNPQALEKKVAQCQAMVSQTKEQKQQCEVVEYAAANFQSLMYEEQQDAKKFGQRILETEVSYAQDKQTFKTLRQELKALQDKNASAAEIKPIEDKIAAVKKTLDEKKNELKVMLAVIGMFSPE